MNLNLPEAVLTRFPHEKNVLIAGIGGGYDVFGGLPIAYELETQWKKNIVLANYSSRSGIFSQKPEEGDEPEYALSQMVDWPVFMLGREGVQTVRRGYEQILEQVNCSTLFLVDGGVDSLMRGNEEGAGTVLEDTISMEAISQLTNVHNKILVCLGFSTEIEEDVSHFQALENMADLFGAGAFLGCCALTQGMECYTYYQEVARKIMDSACRQSHIHSRIIPAVKGQFGNWKMYENVDARVGGCDGSEVFVNPLMAIMWFFDFNIVHSRSLLAPAIKLSGTFTDAQILFRQFLENTPRKKRQDLPIK